MTEKLSRLVASFLKNIIELGVCENCSCANAYQEPTTELLRSVLHPYYGEDTQKLPTQSMALTPPSTGFLGDFVYTECAASRLLDATRHLISTPEQMSSSLADYIDTTFTAISVGYGATIDILLRSLCLVEKVQKVNLCAYHHSLAQQLEDITVSNTNSPSAGSCVQVPAPRQPSHFVNDEFFSPKHVPSGVPTSLIVDDGVFPIGYSPPLSKIKCDSNLAVDSKECFPHVTGKCSVPSEVSLLTATSCHTERTQHHEPSVTPLFDPSSQTPYSLCSVCRSGNVFSLQYYNIHPFLAASLLLNLKIGTVAPVNKTVRQAIAIDVARACGCEVSQLMLAEWLICAALDYNITISVHEIEGLVRRLRIVEVME